MLIVSKNQGLMSLVSGVVILAGVLSGTVAAQSAPGECACSLGLGAANAAVGAVGRVSGRVVMSMKGGFVPVSPGTAIVRGATIMVGTRSSAALRFGSCSFLAPAGATIVVQSTQTSTCVSLNTRPVANGPSNAPAPPSSAAAAAPSAATAGAAGVAAPLVAGPVASLATLVMFGVVSLGLAAAVVVDAGIEDPISK